MDEKYFNATEELTVRTIEERQRELMRIVAQELGPLRRREMSGNINMNDRMSTSELLEMNQFFKEIKEKQETFVKHVPGFDNLIYQKRYNDILKIISPSRTLDEKQFEIFYNTVRNEPTPAIIKFRLKDGLDQYLTISEPSKDFLKEWLTEGFNKPKTIQYGSDAIEKIEWIGFDDAELSFLPPFDAPENDGGFFPYFDNSILDLSRYQIYKNDQVNNTHCLLHALTMAEIPKQQINAIKLSIEKGANFSKKYFNTVVKIIKRDIELRYIDKRNKQVTQKFKFKGKDKEEGNTGESVKLALIFNHYFIYENTPYSKFYIEHYNEIEELIKSETIKIKQNKSKFDICKIEKVISKLKKKDNFRYKISYTKKPSDKRIDSLKMIQALFKQGLFVKQDFNKFEHAETDCNTREHYYLNNETIDAEQKEIKTYKHKANEIKNIHFSDTENFTQPLPGKKDLKHRLALIGDCNMNGDIKIFDVCSCTLQTYEKKRQRIVEQYFDYITNKGTEPALVYFHNLKYDFGVLINYLKVFDWVCKGGQIYSITIFHKNKKIEFRDSYKMISFPLSKFNKNFKLDKNLNKKEAIAYNYYTEENYDKIIQIREYMKYLPNDKIDIFKDNMKEEQSFDKIKQTFNPTTYYKRYLKYDCLVLRGGMIEFDKQIKEITLDDKGERKEENDFSMSIFDALTISSITDKFMMYKGAYDGIFEMCGNLRKYVSNAVSGGRVHANTQYVKKVINQVLADYDGVSLYPSAIYRLAREKGYPLGKAKVYYKNELSTWKQKFYSVLTIRILHVNKKQQMPMICVRGGDSLNYTNNPLPDKDIIVDNITLEDWIEHHQIEFEIIEGVYWNEGGNQKIGQLVQDLFNQRLKAKKAKLNALQQVLKLMLNSIYGKTIEKKTKSQHFIIDGITYSKNGKEKNNFNYRVKKYFNTIKQIKQLGNGQYDFEQLTIDNSFNRGHCGAMVLSYSKRIMNEVFSIANDNNLPIYYTDTDSLHMNYEDVSILEKEFKKKYNRVLTGKQLGQFHIDFDLDGACDEIKSIKAIFLGKKAYIDLLQSKDENGNTIQGLHYRMKGCTVEGIENQSKLYSKNKIEGIFKLYELLTIGKEIEVQLNPYDKENNSEKVLFSFVDYQVATKETFTRKLKF